LDESLQLAPDEPVLLGNRLQLLWQTGRAEEALNFFEQHAHRFGSPELALIQGKILEALGRDAESAEAFRRAFDRATEPEQRLRAGYALALSLTRLERLPEAAALIDHLLELDPGRNELLVAKRLLSQVRR
jgi:tetratricopeptide (TPR) repeat protein